MSRTIIAALGITVAIAAIASSLTGAAATLEPPNAPTQFHGDVIGPFGWTDNSDNEDGFRVYVQMPDADPRLSTEFPANTTSGGVPQTFEELCFSFIWIVAFNDAGESAPSNTVTLPPPPGGCPATLHETYTNDTGGPAVRLLIEQIGFLREVRLITNAPGCETPQITHTSVDADISWGQDACVDPGEQVVLEFDVTSPISLGTPSWVHPPAADTPSPTLAPTATPAPTPTPGALPSAGSAPGAGAAPLLWLGLAIAAAGVLFLSALGGTARHVRPRR